jgi:glycosyltransferase involved in cell wall biosynthesis
MLSILIPTYDYSVVQLVKSLYEQLKDQKISFEIICFDNGSKSNSNKINNEINNIPFCNFTSLENDVGRSKIRNLLAQKSTYDWLLFLDSDVIPCNGKFIEKYLESVNNGYKVVYGGLKYYNNKPSKEFILRWVYGKSREEIPIEKRILKPDKYFSSANFLIDKKAFNTVSFDENLTKYGHEDTMLAIELNNINISIHQIDNPVYHLGLDENHIFIKKTKKAVENLLMLQDQKKVKPDYNKLLRSFSDVKKIKMKKIFTIFFKISSKKMEKNLVSKKPSLKIYDLYKLSYLCSISKN